MDDPEPVVVPIKKLALPGLEIMDAPIPWKCADGSRRDGDQSMIRKSAMSLVALLSMTAAGCNAIQDHFITFETDTRNTVLSQKGWMNWASCYNEVDYKSHFAKGFKEGYTNILEGGRGCQPTLPPRCYWKPHYQTPVGRAKINAWFDGYSHGAVAAKQDGFGSLQQLPISPTARANLMTRQAPPSGAFFAEMSNTGEEDPLMHPEIHKGDQIDEPPMDVLRKFEADAQQQESPSPPARPYDEGTIPVIP